MVTLYWIIKYITFPGTLLKGFLEQLFCRIFGVPVEYSEYMQRNDLCGHTEHVLAPDHGSFGICFFPHLIMLVLGLITAFPASFYLFYLGDLNVAAAILLYISISFLTNCNPLYEDALNMWSRLYGKDSTAKKVTKVFAAIPAVIMVGFSWLEQYGLTILSAFGITYGLSYLVALFF